MTSDIPFIQSFLNQEGIVKTWPSKQSKQILVLEYLAAKIPYGQRFSEKEFNELLKEWHSFDDVALLRRELYIKHHIDRSLDGSLYWKTEVQAQT